MTRTRRAALRSTLGFLLLSACGARTGLLGGELASLGGKPSGGAAGSNVQGGRGGSVAQGGTLAQGGSIVQGGAPGLGGRAQGGRSGSAGSSGAGGSLAGAGGTFGGEGGAGGAPELGCGNGVVEPGEQCDDHNELAGDGCSATCRWEPVRLSLATAHVCALAPNGELKCWGANSFGALGLGDTTFRGYMPGQMGDALPAVDLGKGRKVLAVATGYYQSCAILDNHALKCWGNNSNGELGLGDITIRGDDPGEMGDNLPEVDLGTGRTALAVACGFGFSCALLDDHSVKCWGYNQYGALGQGDIDQRGDQPGEMGDHLPPIDLGMGRSAKAISSVVSSTVCALLDDDELKCWGVGLIGLLGLGDNVNRGDKLGQMGDALPEVPLGTGRRVLQVSTGSAANCALLDDGSAKCWGREQLLGNGTSQSRGTMPGDMGDALPPLLLGSNREALSIGVGIDNNCAVLNDGGLKCWGINGTGQLGYGDTLNRGDQPGTSGDNLPLVDLGTGKKAKQVVVGQSSTCALLTDGSVKCWGANGGGQLGYGDMLTRGNAPGQMGDALPTVDLSF